MLNLRVPGPIDELQVNFCKNPRCRSFGIPDPVRPIAKGRPKAGQPKPSVRYTLSGAAGEQVIKCVACGETPPVKSNLAIAEELDRIGRYLQPRPTPAKCCPNPACVNHAVSVEADPSAYHRFGTTKAGSPRWRCQLCAKTFSIAKRSTLRQRRPHKNLDLFRLLHAGISLTKLAHHLELAPQTLYDRIDWLHGQCLGFLSEREGQLQNRPFDDLHLATDRQSYLTNWHRNGDPRNNQFSAIGTADLASGYVFAMNVPYDPDLDPNIVEEEAIRLFDLSKPPPFRRHARVWLQEDYDKAARQAARENAVRGRRAGLTLEANVRSVYDEVAVREDPEAASQLSSDRQLPNKGMQVHAEYTMYAHFRLLRRLLGGAERINFYMDQESGIRAAMLSAFVDEVRNGDVHGFYVSLAKDKTVNEKRAMLKAARARHARWLEGNLEAAALTHPGPEIMRIIDEMDKGLKTIGQYRDLWLRHPFPTMSEPEKMVCHLTGPDLHHADLCAQEGLEDSDTTRVVPAGSGSPPALSQWDLAMLIHWASLHAIDRYFMQIRRDIRELERGIPVASNNGRIWYGYAPYNPAMIQKRLDIHRVYYNYIQVGEDGKTRAQRFGLARGKIRHEDVVYST